ncbi:MAG: hypothetical protein IT432_17090 [Phycisphaerales bacterium]|nr:hypothetical protein [Phycisphaerales bacterium]
MELTFPAGPTAMLAEWLPGPPFPMLKGMPVPPDRIDHIKGVVEKALSMYPPGFLASQLRGVIVENTIAYDSQSCNGTYIFDLVFIAAGAYPENGKRQDDYTTRAVHHEISSVLLNKHRGLFDEARFRSANPPGFVYADEGGPKLGSSPVNTSPEMPEMKYGFLANYARQNLEQDFNSFAEVMLWEPGILLEPELSEMPIGRKARAVRDFYVAIDTRFASIFDPPPRAPEAP